MYTKLPKYRKPLSMLDEPKVAVDRWDAAYDSFEGGNYKDSVVNVINYINPNLLKGKDLSGNVEFTQAHGSALINIKISDDGFFISAPFLKMENANKVALMRRVAEVNFHPLTLAKISLKDDVLWFEYSTPLELCQPNKVYDVIREICVYADDYDDEFIEKYKASFYHEPKITELTDEEKDKVWEHFQEIGEEYKKFAPYFEQKRWGGSMWDIIVISLLNIANMPYVNGVLISDVQEYIYNIYNRDIDFSYRIDKGHSFLMKLFNETSKEELLKNMYYAEKLIPVKYRSSMEILQKEFGYYQENIDKEIGNGQLFAAAYSLQSMFLRVLYDFNVEDAHKKVIQNALEKSSGLEVEDAVKVLNPVFRQFLEGKVGVIEEAPKKNKKGLFAKLFG